MKNILILTLIVFSFHSWGQIGIVTDSDGFLNVRDRPSGKVIDTINQGEVFFISINSEDSIWIAIEYGEGYNLGYVHHSKILEVTELNSPTESIPELVFKTEKVINIENKGFYGGLNLPLEKSYELVEINLIKQSDTILQDPKYSKNVLVPFLPSATYSHKELVGKNKMILYAYKNFIYYRMKIGDGSEYYESIWVVKNGKIIQRLIGWIV